MHRSAARAEEARQRDQEMRGRQRAEAALRLAEERLGYHMENSPLAVIEWDSSLRVVRWTSAAERVFGREPRR